MVSLLYFGLKTLPSKNQSTRMWNVKWNGECRCDDWNDFNQHQNNITSLFLLDSYSSSWSLIYLKHQKKRENHDSLPCCFDFWTTKLTKKGHLSTQFDHLQRRRTSPNLTNLMISLQISWLYEFKLIILSGFKLEQMSAKSSTRMLTLPQAWTSLREGNTGTKG